MKIVVNDVPRDEKPCPWCGKTVAEHQALSLMGQGEIRWSCATCAIQKNGRGISLLIPEPKATA